MNWTPEHNFIEILENVSLGLSPIQRAEAISRALHKIVNANSTMLLFSVFEHPTNGRAVMVADVNKPIPVNSTAAANELISLVDAAANQQEKDAFVAMLQQVPYFDLKSILPHGTNYLTYEQVEALGWFEE